MTEITNQAGFRTAIGHFATGVTVVTTTGEEGPYGATANAVCSLSLDPMLVLACLDRDSRTLTAVRDRRRLAVNVLGSDQEALARIFADHEMPVDEKWSGVAFAEVDGLPVLDGALAWITGDVLELLPGGDHEIAIASVSAYESREGEPLVFFRGGYHGLRS